MKILAIVTLVIIAIVALFFVGGNAVTNNLSDAFRKINMSLESSNKAINIRNRELINHIDLYTELSKTILERADSLNNLTWVICSFIDSVKTVMLNVDTLGNNLDLSNEILIKNGTGIELFRKMKMCHQLSITFFGNESVNKKRIDTIFAVVKPMFNKQVSISQMFGSGVPTISAITSLSKCQSDCLNATNLVLNSINNEISIRHK